MCFAVNGQMQLSPYTTAFFAVFFDFPFAFTKDLQPGGINHQMRDFTSGIDVAIITGRKAKLLEDRCTTLGITHLYQGQSDKLIAYRELLAKLDVQPDEVAYVGDDLIDWPVMAEIGLSVAVADAHPLLLPRADYVTRIAGGRGAVREVCDLLLLAQGKLDEAKGQSI